MASLRDAALIAVAHTALAGTVAWYWLTLIGAQRSGLDLAWCAAPAVLAVGLSLTSQADRQQYVARLLACGVMLPILLMMWAGSQDPVGDAAVHAAPAAPPLRWLIQPWVFFSAFAVGNVLLLLAAIWWLAAAVTRVEAVAGAGRVGQARLGQRLQSLVAAGVPFDVAAGAQPGQWRLTLRLPATEGRSHAVTLDIDEPAGQVFVRERLGLHDAAPRNADEASLRSLGDASFDPARPDAQRIAGRSIQTTMIDPTKLAAVRLDLTDDLVRLPDAAPTEPEAIVTLLCALVTRSGYAWQPVLGRQRRH
ncbi:MAG: hypothetical protein ABI574_06770 [Burkholderiales bacterium]